MFSLPAVYGFVNTLLVGNVERQQFGASPLALHQPAGFLGGLSVVVVVHHDGHARVRQPDAYRPADAP